MCFSVCLCGYTGDKQRERDYIFPFKRRVIWLCSHCTGGSFSQSEDNYATCQIRGEKQTVSVDKKCRAHQLIDGTGYDKQRVQPISRDTHILTYSDYR